MPFVSDGSTKNVACNRTCTIAVAVMIDSCNYCIFETVKVLQGTEKSNGKCFFAYPSFSKMTDVLHVGLIVIK